MYDERMKKELERLVVETLGEMGLGPVGFVVEYPSDMSHGDYSTNIAMVLAKPLGKNPKSLAEEIKTHLESKEIEDIEKIEVAGPGFINFYLSKEFFRKSLGEVIEAGESFGRNDSLNGEKTIVEYTDPNPFKEFHIGHLMSNTIGEAVSRIFEWNGAEVKRACYQGDVGMHVAKAVYGLENVLLRNEDYQKTKERIENGAKESLVLLNDTKEALKIAYSHGYKMYDKDEFAKERIIYINKSLYNSSDAWINFLFEGGKRHSLEQFEEIYKKLGTKFDYYFFESETGPKGKEIVEENMGKVFEESDPKENSSNSQGASGAIIFRGEKFNPKLHTRVFVNSEGLPTYEAKELGLAPAKYEKYPYEKSVVVTGNEVNEYFKVLLEAMKQVLPELAEKTEHISHGMLRLPTGKMSSRTGDVITAEELIEDVKNKTEGREDVAIGALKYMILRQAIGGDIIFDIEKSVSTEGDSGVYLQYAYARSNSILEKAEIEARENGERGEVREVEKLLYRFPEIIERSLVEYSPNIITTYLTELASAFNNFYAHEQVLNDSPEASYRLAIVRAFNVVMKNGLSVLGIPAPESV